MSESARGSGVEVTERDHEDHRERVEGVINPAARSQHDGGSNLHRRCRTGGVSSPRVSFYTPSHTSTYSPVPAKSHHINEIPAQHTTPRCRNWVQGGGRGATPRKTGVLRTPQVFLRHTCRAGSLPSEFSFAGRPTPPAASVEPVTSAPSSRSPRSSRGERQSSLLRGGGHRSRNCGPMRQGRAVPCRATPGR